MSCEELRGFLSILASESTAVFVLFLPRSADGSLDVVELYC